jgi:hypothetical protein
MTAYTVSTCSITSGTPMKPRPVMCERTESTHFGIWFGPRNNISYPLSDNGLLLFGKTKIWGEIVEHENGYRSQFAKVVSLDYGAPELLDKYRKIYRVNQ